MARETLQLGLVHAAFTALPPNGNTGFIQAPILLPALLGCPEPPRSACEFRIFFSVFFPR